MLILIRKLHRVAAGEAAGDDRHLLHRVGVFDGCGDERMPAFVIRGDLFFFLRDDAALALRAHDHFLGGLKELGLSDRFLVVPRGGDGCLIHQVREVGAGETRRARGDAVEVHVLFECLAFRMDLEDRLAVVHVGEIEDDAAVEAAGPEERRVKDIRAVRGGKDDHARVAIEAVHLHEDLVQCLLALVTAAAHPGAALAADGVDLVDEEDRGRGALGLHEGVARARGADTDEHLHELGCRI